MTEFGDIITDSAVLIVDGVQLTASRGGWSFDPGEQWEDFPFPGRTMNTRGARELVRLQPSIRGNAMLTGEPQVSAYRPDGTWSDSLVTDARIFRPNALRTRLTEADYLQNVFIIWKRQRGDFFAVEFPWAIATSWNLGAQDGDEGLIALVIEAAQHPGAGNTKTRRPYRLHTLPGETEIGDLPTSDGSDS